MHQHLAHAMAHLQDDLARRAHEGPARLHASVREVIAQVQREYGMIHHDFRHEVDEALDTFVRALDTSLTAVHLRLPMERVANFLKRSHLSK